MKLVSIVLPTYNGSRYIRDSINSCLAQTHPDFELVIVDDCSTDYTSAILDTYHDPRIRRVRNAQNRKLPASLNAGFSISKGDYLTWTSDDNLYAPNAIEVMVEALERRPEIGLVYAGSELINENGEIIRPAPAEPPHMLMQRCVVGACFLYRREVYEKVGDYNENLFRIEDYDYWLRVAQEYEIAALDEILYSYRIHASSLTSQESLEERARAYDDLHSRLFGPDPKRFSRNLSELYMSRAFEAHLAGDNKNVRLYALEAIKRDKSHLSNRGVWAIFVRSFLAN